MFTVPTRARDVLHNHQHAVKDLSKAISAWNSKRSLQKVSLSLCRGVRLYLHTLSQRKQVSRNEKKKKCVTIRVKKFFKAVSASFFRIISNQLCQVAPLEGKYFGYNKRLITGSKCVIVVKKVKTVIAVQ